MAFAIDNQLSKSIRTFEHDRQRRRKPRDRRKNKQSHQCYCCHPSKYDGNGGTLRAGREKLCIQKVTLMHREAIAFLYRDDDIVDEDWVADSPGPLGSRVDLAAIIFNIAKPERQRRRGVAKDFVMVPSVNRVQYLDAESTDGFDDEEDDWEVLGGPALPRSYASVACP